MTTLYQDLKDKLARLHVLEQMIVVNALVFLVTGLLSLVISNGRFYVLDFLSLSNDIWQVFLNPWTIITYGFLHYNLSHLFFNMLVLYILARTFANLYRPRMALKIYVLGIISWTRIPPYELRVPRKIDFLWRLLCFVIGLNYTGQYLYHHKSHI